MTQGGWHMTQAPTFDVWNWNGVLCLVNDSKADCEVHQRFIFSFLQPFSRVALHRAGWCLTVWLATQTNTQLQQLCAWVPFLATAPTCPPAFTSGVKAALGM